MKKSIEDLAILGGVSSFKEPLHVGRPNVGDEERFLARVRDMLGRRWFTNAGPFVQEFETALARYVGVKHCIPVCNGTVALELAIRALGMRGEVIVPAFTFVATAHALQWQEIVPVFCDIDPATHCLSSDAVRQAITPRTGGLIGVHVWGHPCAIPELEFLAENHGFPLIFDASHAFGCSYGGRKIGNFGHAEVFSFHATKFFNTFEGGAIATNDDDLAAKIRLMKNFGFAGYDNVIYLGINGKMTEVCAAMGLTGLESLGEFMSANQRNCRIYREELTQLPGISWVTGDESQDSNSHYAVVEVEESLTGIHRDLLLKILHAENVLARRYFYPGCHRMEPYRSQYPNAGALLPETEKVAGRVLVLPNGMAVTADDASTVCQIIRFAIEHCADICRRLEAAP